MADNENKNKDSSIFRKEALDTISSPEQLTSYLRVTTPGIWVVLIAVILILAGIFVWAAVGTLETTEKVTVIVEDNEALVISNGGSEIRQGMILRVSGAETKIVYVEKDEYGRSTGRADISLADGTYEGTIVVEQTKPIEFLLRISPLGYGVTW